MPLRVHAFEVLLSCSPPWPLYSARVVATRVLSTWTSEILTVCPIYISLLLQNSNVTAPVKSQPVVALAALPPQGSLLPKGNGDNLPTPCKLYAVLHMTNT